MSDDAVQRLADELEEHGRALLAKARELRRSAGGGERSTSQGEGFRGRSSGDRPRGRSEGRDSGGGNRSRRSSEGGGNRREAGEAPEWAPTPKRRKT